MTHAQDMPQRCRGNLFTDSRPILEVSVKELNRRTYRVLGRVSAGSRVVVTRHGRPIAVMVSLPDAEELLVADSERFALLRREAREELARGLLRAAPHGTLSSAARRGLKRLGGGSWPRLRRGLVAVAREIGEDDHGLTLVRAGYGIATCEVIGGTLLVYAIGHRRSLRRLLLGDELSAEMWRRQLERWTHGRS